MNANPFNFDASSIVDQFFRRVDNAVWDLMSGGMGIIDSDGNVVSLKGDESNAYTTVNMIKQFGMPIPAFAQATPAGGVKFGDLVYGPTGPMGWVVKVLPIADGGRPTFELLSATGNRSTWVQPAVIGFDAGVMILRDLTSMFSNGATGLGQMSGMLMPMLMSGADISKILPMMLFMQNQPGAAGAAPDANNPMAGMMSMLPMMMMANLMGGDKGGLFGGNGNGTGQGSNFFDQPTGRRR